MLWQSTVKIITIKNRISRLLFIENQNTDSHNKFFEIAIEFHVIIYHFLVSFDKYKSLSLITCD